MLLKQRDRRVTSAISPVQPSWCERPGPGVGASRVVHVDVSVSGAVEHDDRAGSTASWPQAQWAAAAGLAGSIN